MLLRDLDSPDVVLIGAGIMGATVRTVLKELEPALSVVMFETLDDCGQESSEAWNNAGTGHAANCELSYTPQRSDGTVDSSKALEVNTEFDTSWQLWAHLVRKGAIPDPRAFIHAVPHMSFVWGRPNVAFLRERYGVMSARHCYSGMAYTGVQCGDWKPAVAGQRVQIIKPDEKRGGILEFGTELVPAPDRSLVALHGASPGASTAAFIALAVLQTCFADRLTEEAWLPRLKRMVPTYGIDLKQDADACRRTLADTAAALKIDNI